MLWYRQYPIRVIDCMRRNVFSARSNNGIIMIRQKRVRIFLFDKIWSRNTPALVWIRRGIPVPIFSINPRWFRAAPDAKTFLRPGCRILNTPTTGDYDEWPCVRASFGVLPCVETLPPVSHSIPTRRPVQRRVIEKWLFDRSL